MTQSLNLVKDVIAAVNSKVCNYEKKMRLGEIYNRTDSKSIMRMKSGQMFAREDLRHRKLIRDGPVSLKNAAGRLKGKTILSSAGGGYSSPSLDVGLVLRLVSPAFIYSSALGDFDISFPCAVHSLPITAFLIPRIVSGVIDSCFCSWRLHVAESLGCSDTTVHQPRSRVAGGPFGPGERDGAAVGQSSESDLCAMMCVCSSSRKHAYCFRNPSSASQWLCPPAALPFPCSEVCSRSAQAQRYHPGFTGAPRGVPGICCS